MDSVRYIIYGLVDPQTRLVHYVGKSSSGLRRVTQHRRDPVDHPATKVAKWIDTLPAGFEGVVLEVLKVDAPGTLCWWWSGLNASSLNDAERWWIAFGRACGWPLTNITDGGAGIPGYKHTPEFCHEAASRQRERMAKPAVRAKRSRDAAAAATPKARARAAESMRIRMSTPEARAQSANNANKRWARPGEREKASERMRRRMSDPVMRAAAADRMRLRMAEPETRATLFEKLRALTSTPEVRVQLAERSRKRWNKPGERLRASERMKVLNLKKRSAKETA